MNLELLKQRAKAFDYLFDAVVVTDLQGIITDWNKGSEALYGYSQEEAVGQPVNILHVPEDTEYITKEVISAVNARGSWNGEIRILHKDGYIGWVESMCVPIFETILWNASGLLFIAINMYFLKFVSGGHRLARKSPYLPIYFNAWSYIWRMMIVIWLLMFLLLPITLVESQLLVPLLGFFVLLVASNVLIFLLYGSPRKEKFNQIKDFVIGFRI